MKYHKLRPVYFLPLLLALMLYGCYSVRSIKQTENLDRMLTILFAGEILEPVDWILMESYSRDDLLKHMESWHSGRQKAAFLILEYNGLDYPDSVSKDRKILTRASKAGDSDEEDPLLLKARENFLNREYESAEKNFREYWFRNIHNSEKLPASSLLVEIRNSIVKTDEAPVWIDFLSEWKGFAASGFGGSFFLASCYEKTAVNDDALYWYEQSISRSDNWEEIRRSQWYIIRLLSRKYPERLPSYLMQTGTLRNTGGYFDDVLDEYYSTLVRYRRWQDLLQLVPAVIETGLSESASQGYFLLQKAQDAGYLSADSLTALTEIYRPDPRGYFALRSAPEKWPVMSSRSESPMASQTAVADKLYTLILSAGYEEEALTRLEDNREDLSADTVVEFCRYLETEGDLYELIRFAGYWFYRLPPEEGMILLPWVFPGAGRYALPEDIVPEELILGVIRRESAFHEGISSRVGAGGLMQLMPATAAELARKNKMSEWDLMNPEDNILLGTLYLNWLLERPWTGSYVDVLAAYNGGGGNLRTWKRRFPSSDPDLFIQSIPFRETRNYVRKVIVAAASYRYLETGLPPGEWLDQFYQPF
jgi:peptidoglycan lytic transglycosylase